MITESYYVETADNIKERLRRVDNIIQALETMEVAAASKGDIDSYSFDDGQVSVNMSYRSPATIARAIRHYESIKQKLLNKLNGRVIILRDWRGLR